MKKDEEKKELSKNIDELDKCAEESRMKLNQSYSRIDDRMEAIKTVVDEEGTRFKTSIQSSTDRQLTEIEKRRQKLGERKNAYEDVIETVKQEQKLQSTSSFHQFFIASDSRLHALSPLCMSIPLNTCISFVGGTLNQKLIRDMIGQENVQMSGSATIDDNEILRSHNESDPLERVNSIRSKLRIVCMHRLPLQAACLSICTGPGGSVWIGGDGYVFQMSSDYSTIINRIPTREHLPCAKIASLQSGDVLACYERLPYFMDKFTSDGKRKDYANFIESKACANDIAVTDQDEIVVKGSTDGWFKSSKSFLLIYSKQGSFLREIQYERTMNSFCITNGGNLIISHTKSSDLTKVDTNGAVLGRLPITRSYLEKMICDRYGNIVGYFGGNRVCLISGDMEVELAFTVKCDNGINDICLDRDDRLLILVDDNKVIVTEYMEC